MTTSATTETRECLGCGRTLRSAAAVARGYGSGCWAKIRKAERTADLSAWTPRQLEDARELIGDGGVVPTAKPGVFRTVSTRGDAVYLSSARWCGCPNGLKDSQSHPCYHRAAVVIVLAASAAPAVTLAVPAPAPVTAPDVLWAEIERLNDAFMSAA
jgi:hypothetical protein